MVMLGYTQIFALIWCPKTYHIFAVGSQIPHQGQGYLCPRLSCPFHGTYDFSEINLPHLTHVQHNMLIRPTEEQLADFGEPDFIIYNAGQFPANRFTKGMSSTTSVEINFKRMEMVILGTEYAGEMKKGVFSVMVCFLPSINIDTLIHMP